MKKINRDPTMTKKWGSRAKLESGLSLSFFFFIQLGVKKKKVSIAFTYIFVTKYPFCFKKIFFKFMATYNLQIKMISQV